MSSVLPADQEMSTFEKYKETLGGQKKKNIGGEKYIDRYFLFISIIIRNFFFFKKRFTIEVDLQICLASPQWP